MNDNINTNSYSDIYSFFKHVNKDSVKKLSYDQSIDLLNRVSKIGIKNIQQEDKEFFKNKINLLINRSLELVGSDNKKIDEINSIKEKLSPIIKKREFNLSINTSALTLDTRSRNEESLSKIQKSPIENQSMTLSRNFKFDDTDLQKMYGKLMTGFTSIEPKDIQTFVERGGRIEILGNKPITLEKGKYFTGCTAGVNRSQALAAHLKLKDCDVLGIFAGSLLNRRHDVSHFEGLEMHISEFKEVFEQTKQRQIGYDAMDLNEFFETFFQQLEPVTFICFGECSLNLIKRLVDCENKDLSNFRIIHIPWDDEIQYPKDHKPWSVEAHQALKDKLEQFIIIK